MGIEGAAGPSGAEDAAALVARLRELRERSGRSYRELEKRARARGTYLPRSTVAGMLSRSALPREDLLVAFVQVCGDGERAGAWLAARQWIASRASRADPHDGGREVAAEQREQQEGPGPCLNHLPRDVADFTGRDAEIDRMVAAVTDGVGVLAVDGMAGVGKTALVVRAGHLLAERFPDGLLYVDLHGHSEGKAPLAPTEALELLLGQIGADLPPGSAGAGIRRAEARWRAETEARQLLVVLDNAGDEAQVKPLLPSGGGTSLITSRIRLSGIDAARPLSLDVLSEREALAFFTRVIGADRAAAEPEAVSRIVRFCAGLPLALRLSGARLAHRPVWSVSHLWERMGSAGRPLSELSSGGRRVDAVFQMSYAQLPAFDQLVFKALAQHPGADADADAAVVGAMAQTSQANAEEALQRLVDVHLAEEVFPGRYRQHDLLREYARSLTTNPKLITRMLDHYVTTITEALKHPDPAAEAWLASEHSNLLAATRCAAANGQTGGAWQLAVALWRLLTRGPAHDVVDLLEHGLSGLRDSSEGGEAVLATMLAVAHWSAGRRSLARKQLEDAVQAHEDTESRARTLAMLSLVHLDGGDYGAAWEHAQLAMAELAGLTELSPLGVNTQTMSCLTQGVIQGLRGNDASALEFLRAAHHTCEQLGDRLSPTDHVLTELARCLTTLGDVDEAAALLQQARSIRKRIGDRIGEAEAIALLGAVRRAQGHYAEAAALGRSAVDMLTDQPRPAACALLELGHTLAEDDAATADEATEVYRQALHLAVTAQQPHEEALALQALATTLAPTDPHTAQRYRERATGILAQLGVSGRMTRPHLRPGGW